MATVRKKDSTGRIRYEGDFALDGWLIEWCLFPNEPNGTPSFSITGRRRININGDFAKQNVPPARSLPEPVRKALQMQEKDYRR